MELGTLVSRRQTGIIGRVEGFTTDRVTVAFSADLNPGRRGRWTTLNVRRGDLRVVDTAEVGVPEQEEAVEVEAVDPTPETATEVKATRGKLKLSPEQAQRVRDLAADGMTKADLSKKFGVGPRCIGRILDGKTHAA
jgi:hypothetical protein